jgi:hypothetical protein
MRAARHRQRDRAIDDRAYQPLGRDVDEKVLQHDRSPQK